MAHKFKPQVIEKSLSNSQSNFSWYFSWLFWNWRWNRDEMDDSDILENPTREERTLMKERVLSIDRLLLYKFVLA